MAYKTKWDGRARFAQPCAECGQQMAAGTYIRRAGKGWAHDPVCPKQGAVVVADDFTASYRQAAIYAAMDTTNDNLMVDACPGSGKTTTLKHAGPHLPSQAAVIALVFGKNNSNDLKKALPNVLASTIHAAGLRFCSQALGCKVEQYKLWNLVDEHVAPEMAEDDGAAIRKLVDLAKDTLSPVTDEGLDDLCERFSINLLGDPGDIYPVVRDLFKRSVEDTSTADFADMVHWVATGRVKTPKFDVGLLDESQDVNDGQIAFFQNILAPGARVLIVGDPMQSIYQFRGAAADSMERLAAAFNTVKLPLDITYRLPASHVELVNARFGTSMQARPGAPEGELLQLSYEEMVAALEDGDGVACRTNAPLVGPAFECLRRNQKAVILGRNIGGNLTALLKKVRKLAKTDRMVQVLGELMEYAGTEVAKLEAARKPRQAANLTDSAETLIALADGCATTGEVEDKIKQIFSDTKTGVVFGSVHKWKGGEAERFYVYGPEQFPHKMAKTDEALKSERNVEFVALTRSKQAMAFVPLKD